MLKRNEAISELNRLGEEEIPFLFLSSFLGDRVWIKPLHEISEDEVLYSFNGVSNWDGELPPVSLSLERFPIPFVRFKAAFDRVVSEINYGNSFLTNLTFKTPINLNVSFREVFQLAQARYKLWFRDEFVCFSPEIFVQIDASGIIKSYPMKGTIHADLPNAANQLLDDEKELAEHITIVDLIRNDLSRFARNVEVARFRYLDEIKTNKRNLLQASSEIIGELDSEWKSKLGDILLGMIPAGSISGAPKPQTLEIIRVYESYKRGFYTGICGIFDGHSIDTGVMIRFIERTNDGLFYKSGGGITSRSKLETEYAEYINKIYVPLP